MTIYRVKKMTITDKTGVQHVVQMINRSGIANVGVVEYTVSQDLIAFDHMVEAQNYIIARQAEQLINSPVSGNDHDADGA